MNMKRNIVRRLAALAAAAGLCFACAAPVFAEETEWEYLQQVRLESEYGSWIITRPSAARMFKTESCSWKRENSMN